MKPYEPIQNGAFLHVLRKDVFFCSSSGTLCDGLVQPCEFCGQMKGC